jgi:thioredoxin reductase (NADPH)
VVSNLVSNALESHAQVFPVLTEAQINRIRPFASLRHVNDGDVLFRADDSDAPFFILLSGSMEIVQPDMNGERLVANHGLVHRGNDDDYWPSLLRLRPDD